MVRDEKSVERDQVIARHVFELHCVSHRGEVILSSFIQGGGRTIEGEAPIPLQKMKQYISYCRSMCNPILSEEASKKLENFYVEVHSMLR